MTSIYVLNSNDLTSVQVTQQLELFCEQYFPLLLEQYENRWLLRVPNETTLAVSIDLIDYTICIDDEEYLVAENGQFSLECSTRADFMYWLRYCISLYLYDNIAFKLAWNNLKSYKIYAEVMDLNLTIHNEQKSWINKTVIELFDL